MRVGIVSKWFNRGQPVVGRQLRSALDELGHETVRARAAEEGARPAPGSARPRRRLGPARGHRGRRPTTCRRASTSPGSRRTGSRRSSAIRTTSSTSSRSCASAGRATIGRFVWEHFTAEHVAGAREAFDVVYSLTRAEQERYRGMGLETPYVTWGCHPELVAIGEQAALSRPADAGAANGRIRLPGRLPRASQAARAGAGGVRGDRRPAPAAAGQGAGRAQAASAPRPRPPSATRGSSCGSPTSRPPSTCARSRAATSASPRRAGRASGCRCTRRSPSGCPRSPTTRRR